ncbi:protein kinase [Hamiltosporidium magnivora]|uniref:Protein kinase n=1 Tax=Hamiltosporidium magnivora TaxID=148818 RepID=A0A4Q9LAZ5_9MICR|nr:protein kinase [Hamiltosporidium magnivora]
MKISNFCLFKYLYFPHFPHATLTYIPTTDVQEINDESNFTLISHEIISNYSYINIEYLASGAYGYIFKAKDIINGETVVIKIPKSEKDQISLHTEKDFLDNCDHPNIIKYNRELKINNKSCLVLPFYEDTLESVFLNDSLGDSDIRFILKQILDALKHLHSNGIIHNDIKMNNILLKDKRFVKIIDFGLSCRTNKPIKIFKNDGLDTLYSTYEYLSPELRRNMLYNEKSDMWSFGFTVKQLEQKNGWNPKYLKSIGFFDYNNFISCFLNDKAEHRISASTALMSSFFDFLYEFIYCFCPIEDYYFIKDDFIYTKKDDQLIITYYKSKIILHCSCSIKAKNFCYEKILQAKIKDSAFFYSNYSHNFQFGNHCNFMITFGSVNFLLCELDVFELENLRICFNFLTIGRIIY